MRATLCLAVLTVPVLAPAAGEDGRVSVAAARDRAGVMHEVFADTLEVVHRHHFRRDGAVLPPRALEDVSTRLDRRAGVKEEWTAVNTAAMSVTRLSNTATSPQAGMDATLVRRAETDTAFSTSRSGTPQLRIRRWKRGTAGLKCTTTRT